MRAAQAHCTSTRLAQEVEIRQEQSYVVMCAEGPNPRYPGVFRALAALAYARAGDVGPYWAWLDEPCASWPATAVARYAGPWDRPTAHLILVIGNSFDPSTIYEGAVALTRWPALELGLHVLAATLKSEGGRGEIGGILAYARQVHKDDKYLGELCHAAEVFQTLSAQTAGLSPQFLDKAKHLAAIHKAPRETWPVLTGTLLEQS